ncbi:hypothetical protein [Methanococcus voltae]|uniref:ATP synthase H subunit n=1 Tax=Methanococcus voltae (strain ATCC BAA-1334 / A3) TaxID=456320 RepID=D7DRT5_METV3|nr:hypothetical protein [Methanococcus voltae]MCS3901163.1 V/A-type H+-transporting ATPase subunit G/H [Methanococcus voltae]
MIAIDTIKEIKHTENEAVNAINEANKKAEEIKSQAIIDGKKIISEVEAEADQSVLEMVAKAEAKAKEEADCIVANENKKIAEISSLAKVKILSIRLEDVMQFE